MNAKILSVAIAVGGLMAASGTVLAGTHDAHEAYQRVFSGDSGRHMLHMEGSPAMGKAAYGTPSMPSAGPHGGITVLTTNGLAAWQETGPTGSMGRAAYGTASGADTETGSEAYRRGFFGD